MGEVIPFDAPKIGETTFMQCNCKPEGVDFLVVIAQNPPLVCGLMCPECEQHFSVVNGFVVYE